MSAEHDFMAESLDIGKQGKVNARIWDELSEDQFQNESKSLSGCSEVVFEQFQERSSTVRVVPFHKQDLFEREREQVQASREEGQRERESLFFLKQHFLVCLELNKNKNKEFSRPVVLKIGSLVQKQLTSDPVREANYRAPPQNYRRRNSGGRAWQSRVNKSQSPEGR